MRRIPRPSLPALLIATTALIAGSSHAVDELPDIGDSAGALISPEQEYRIGTAFLRNLRSRDVVLEDPELQQYIQALGSRLAEHADTQPNPFTFFVVDSKVLNAFAVPGGFIGVHTGLIQETKSESELAGVLAHEISHVTQRHGARMYEAASQMSIPSAVGMLGAILLGVVAPQAGQAAIAAVAAGQQQYALNFTRANEQEADRIGIQVMGRAGFDPQGMPSFFERMQMANRYNDSALVPEFLRTHPVTTNRIAEARERAEKIATARVEENSQFQLMRAKVIVRGMKEPREAVRYFADSLREGQYVSESVARYGYALALTRAGDYGKAGLQLDRLLQSDPDNVNFQLAMARLQGAQKQYDAALASYARTLTSYPGYRPAVLGRIQVLLDAGQPGEARRELRDYMTLHGGDVTTYQLLAIAEGKAGSKIESHIAQAEYYYGSGELGMALEQLRVARTMPGITYYQGERVQARMDQIQKEMDDEKERKDGF
jgi:predicted Zn-dependent protease